jgi:hypothetical protein
MSKTIYDKVIPIREPLGEGKGEKEDESTISSSCTASLIKLLKS